MPDRTGFSWWRLLAAPLVALVAALTALPAAAQAPLVTCTPQLALGVDAQCSFSPTSASPGRFYLVHVPKTLASAKPALVLDLHGYSLSAALQRQKSGQLAASDQFGFVAVWPQGTTFPGTDKGRSWNAGSWMYNGKENICCGAAAGYDEKGDLTLPTVDDVAFLRSVISDIETQLSDTLKVTVDTNKVYMTGLSNGGAMTHRMACQASDVIHAAGAVSFPLSLNVMDCPATHPLSVTTIQGDMDTEVPYDGGPLSPIPGQFLKVFSVVPAETGVRRWAFVQNCATSPSSTSFAAPNKAGTTTIETYGACGGKSGKQVKLITLPTSHHIPYDTVDDQGDYLILNGDPISIANYFWSTIFSK